MKTMLLALAAATALTPAVAFAQDTRAGAPSPGDNVVARGSSPDSSITVSVAIDGDGRATYAVARRGKPVIAPSALGFLFTDARKIDRSLALASTSQTKSDTSWTQQFGDLDPPRLRPRIASSHS
jgi:alpha-glucosidase